MSALSEYVAARKAMNAPWVRKANAAIESLKCCGNCAHADVGDVEGYVECGEYWNARSLGMDIDSLMLPWDHCQFNPSRWGERQP